MYFFVSLPLYTFLEFPQETFQPDCAAALQLQKGQDWGQPTRILAGSQGQKELAASALPLSSEKLLHTSSLRNTPPTTALA